MTLCQRRLAVVSFPRIDMLLEVVLFFFARFTLFSLVFTFSLYVLPFVFIWFLSIFVASLPTGWERILGVAGEVSCSALSCVSNQWLRWQDELLLFFLLC